MADCDGLINEEKSMTVMSGLRTQSLSCTMASSSLKKDFKSPSLSRSQNLSPTQTVANDVIDGQRKVVTPAERLLLRKLDIRTIPILFWLCMSHSSAHEKGFVY